VTGLKTVGIIFYMFVSPENSYLEFLDPKELILGGRDISENV
jgi:hypothetical protein